MNPEERRRAIAEGAMRKAPPMVAPAPAAPAPPAAEPRPGSLLERVRRVPARDGRHLVTDDTVELALALAWAGGEVLLSQIMGELSCSASRAYALMANGLKQAVVTGKLVAR